jgi:hypothetical protein
MREERTFTPFYLAMLDNFVWRASEVYNPDHLREFTIPRVVDIQLKIARISAFAYGLIALGGYEKPYLSELNHAINEFVRDFDEILSAGSISEEEKFSKMEGAIYNFQIRLVALEDEVKKEYVKRTLEEYLDKHREVFGKDFTLKDLYYLLGRIVDVDDEESPLKEG